MNLIIFNFAQKELIYLKKLINNNVMFVFKMENAREDIYTYIQ